MVKIDGIFMQLLQELHDVIDEENNSGITREYPEQILCKQCLAKSYNGKEGIVHEENCLLLRTRRLLEECKNENIN